MNSNETFKIWRNVTILQWTLKMKQGDQSYKGETELKYWDSLEI